MVHLVALVNLDVMVSKELQETVDALVIRVHLDFLAHKVIGELKVNQVQKVIPVVQFLAQLV